MSRLGRPAVLGAPLAVALVVAGAWALGNAPGPGGGTPDGPDLPSLPAVGEAVPWKPLTASNPRIPTTRVPPSPDPARAAAAPGCSDDQLQATSTRDGAAAGTRSLELLMTAVDGVSCSVRGHPVVRLRADGRPVPVPVLAVRESASYDDPVLVGDGAGALLRVSWRDGRCPEGTGEVDINRLDLAVGEAELSVPGFGQVCAGPGAEVDVASLRPPQVRPAEERSAFHRTAVGGELLLEGARGEPVGFRVALLSPVQVSLATCPDYTVSQSGGGVDATETHALNCADVPFRDDAGDPYLPAGRPVSFEMEVTPAADVVPLLTWALVVPDVTVVVGGEIR